MFHRLTKHLRISVFGLKTVLIVAFLGLPVVTSLVYQEAGATEVQDHPPNIIFVMVDALRADHVSAYGYGRQTTPVLDSRVADKGVLFSEATAVSSWTNPSNGAMLTSLMPSDIDTVWADMNRSIPESETLLAEYLKGKGYVTAGFISSWYMRGHFGYAQGFDTYQATEGENLRRAAAVNELAMTWLDENKDVLAKGDRPLFLFLYYYDPHTHYDPPPPFDTLYDDNYTGFLTPEIYAHGQDVVSGKLTLDERDLEHLIALYDGDISYWDQQFGLMLDDLRRRDLLENSLIVLSSDHGQMFGEHGEWTHRNSLYEEVLRVPLLFQYSGDQWALPEGQVYNEPVDHLDVVPTILELVGIQPPEHMLGRSLLPLMLATQPLQKRPIYAEMAGEPDPEGGAYWIAPRTNLFAIKEDGHKLIHAQQLPQADELYSVEKDSPYERQNIIDAEPETAAALWKRLQKRFTIPTKFLFLPVVERPD